MKKVITIIVFAVAAGMIGWTLYDFLGEEDNPQIDDSGGVTITASPDGDDHAGDGAVGLQKGNEAPDFELETMDGEKVKLSDYRGQRVLINFWATWCPPCRKEIPDLQELYDHKDVEILAVNETETEDSEADVVDFVDEYEMTFPVLADRKSEVGNTYKIPAYPTTYMIDSEGIIRFVAMGAMDYDQMEAELKKID